VHQPQDFVGARFQADVQAVQTRLPMAWRSLRFRRATVLERA
jgi:hypothetical protein